MKDSEYYKQKFLNTDSEIGEVGAYRNMYRAERQERFEERHLQKFQDKFKEDIVYSQRTGAYVIKVFNAPLDKYLFYDFYPKANKVLVRHLNTWHKAGLQWLINNLLNEEQDKVE